MEKEKRKGNVTMMRPPDSSGEAPADLVLDPDEYYDDEGISDDEFYNDGLHEMTPDEEKRYYQQIKESQGFDVERIPNVFAVCLIQPAPIDQVSDLRHFTQFAIDHHNKTKNEGGNLKLVRIIKCNWQGACPLNYYITFEAEDVATGDVGTYQTMVETRIEREKSEVTIFRKKHNQQEKEVESSASRIEQLQHDDTTS